jgi:hypothetical protein
MKIKEKDVGRKLSIVNNEDWLASVTSKGFPWPEVPTARAWASDKRQSPKSEVIRNSDK